MSSSFSIGASSMYDAPLPDESWKEVRLFQMYGETKQEESPWGCCYMPFSKPGFNRPGLRRLWWGRTATSHHADGGIFRSVNPRKTRPACRRISAPSGNLHQRHPVCCETKRLLCSKGNIYPIISVQNKSPYHTDSGWHSSDTLDPGGWLVPLKKSRRENLWNSIVFITEIKLVNDSSNFFDFTFNR